MAAYWIAQVTIHDFEKYQHYMQLAPAAFAKYGAKFLARGGESLCLEGQPYARVVVIEFADLATAQACYDSVEYRAARQARDGSAEVLISLVEGL